MLKHAGGAPPRGRPYGTTPRSNSRSSTTDRPTSAQREAPVGHGIAGIRERAAMCGGTLDVPRRPEHGYGVRAWIPAGVGAEREPDAW